MQTFNPELGHVSTHTLWICRIIAENHLQPSYTSQSHPFTSIQCRKRPIGPRTLHTYCKDFSKNIVVEIVVHI